MFLISRRMFPMRFLKRLILEFKFLFETSLLEDLVFPCFMEPIARHIFLLKLCITWKFSCSCFDSFCLIGKRLHFSDCSNAICKEMICILAATL